MGAGLRFFTSTDYRLRRFFWALLGFFNAEAQRCGTGILPVFHGRDAHPCHAFLGALRSAATRSQAN